jgi:hypothetical protein
MVLTPSQKYEKGFVYIGRSYLLKRDQRERRSAANPENLRCLAPVDFTSSSWVWGAALVRATYATRLFLDSFVYATNHTSDTTSPLPIPMAPTYGNTEHWRHLLGKVITRAHVTINLAF